MSKRMRETQRQKNASIFPLPLKAHFTTREAAAFLGISIHSMRYLGWAGIIEREKNSKNHCFYSLAELNEWQRMGRPYTRKAVSQTGRLVGVCV